MADALSLLPCTLLACSCRVLLTAPPPPPPACHGPQNATRHPLYNPNTLDNDIAIIVLKTAANIKKNPPAVLPAAALSLESKKVTVAGYGTTEAGSIARVLK